MKSYNYWLLLWLVLVFTACTSGPSALFDPIKPETNSPLVHAQSESDSLAQTQVMRRELLEKLMPVIPVVEPVMPVHDPLEDHRVSFAMVQEELQLVLYSLSQAVGMNLIIDPAISDEKRPVTINFQDVSASRVLKEILGTYDLYYEIVENIIRVRPFQERIFHLNFLDTDVTSSFDMGGDVFGAGESEIQSGLSGNFKMTGQMGQRANAYDAIELMVKKMISRTGKYSLNRLSGSLYVKDSPGVLHAISKLVNHYKEMLSRQLLIEARIIEVILADEYRYGIDWEALRDLDANLGIVSQAAWGFDEGLVLSHENKNYSISSTIQALNRFGDAKVVSNPSIRAKHGKPSIISVGTSFTYKKSVDITTESSATQDRDKTEVEVSTVFDGLILGVMPFIEENGKINLLINPIKSDVDQDSLEVQGTGVGESISLPEVNVKEISTTITLGDGDVVILGGLIDKREYSENKGVPVLSAIPVAGYLFKNEQTREEIRELVIILSVSLI